MQQADRDVKPGIVPGFLLQGLSWQLEPRGGCSPLASSPGSSGDLQEGVDDDRAGQQRLEARLQ